MPRDARYYFGRIRRTDWLLAIGDHENEQTTRSVWSEISSEDSGDDLSSCSPGMFDGTASGAGAAVRMQDLERGASSDSEGFVLD